MFNELTEIESNYACARARERSEEGITANERKKTGDKNELKEKFE